MKKIICLFTVLIMLSCGCSYEKQSKGEVFTKSEDGHLVSASGTEYALLANEGVLYYLGDLVFEGSVSGEGKMFQHLGAWHRTGLYSIKDDDTDNILVRISMNNEWFSIYRKTSLPTFDFSVDNCSRLEIVSGIGDTQKDVIHTTCGDGISDTVEIAEFLSDVRSQKNPRDAGIYDLVTKPDGMLENCYVYGVIYGFFESEPNLAVNMMVTSYNDLAYSVCIEGEEYVLPEKWIERLSALSKKL